jgi:transcriptional regulator with XRE-family HTH domain
MAKTALERLKEYRDKHFENDYEMADLLDLTRAHFSQIINGVRRPGLDTAAKIEARTGIPASSWVDTEKSEQKHARKSAADSARVA